MRAVGKVQARQVTELVRCGMGLGDGRQWTKDRVKQYAKAVEIYPVEDMVLPGGEVIQVAVDTRDLNQLQASETIERLIQHFWEEFEIRLPGPNEQMEIAA